MKKIDIYKFDKFWLGFSVGIIAPVITLSVVYIVTFDNYTIHDFIYFLKTMRVMTKLFSLCVLPNLLCFFLFIWPNLLKGAKGVLTATVILALVILSVQFILKAI